jgi:hypothetical protein
MPKTKRFPKPSDQFPFAGLLFLIFSFVVKESCAQSSKNYGLRLDTVSGPLYKSYMNAIGGTLSIYKGAEYTGSYPLTIGTPFFDTTEFEKGLICYDGVLYPGILMAYDLVSNEVVIKGYQQLSIKPDPLKINYFLLRGHLFISGENIEPGKETAVIFYEVLNDGPVKTYARRWKQVERSLNAADPYLFKSYNYYLIEKDSAFYHIKGKKDLLKLFNGKEQSLKSFWKNKKLDFKKNLEHSIVETVAYYTQLME